MISSDLNQPLISCLMVTANGRFDTFTKSFKSYCQQTYVNRELVIVNEGTKEYQQKISEHVKDRKDIRFVFLDGKYTLGALRNIAIRLAYGELFCQWDDDDFSSPDRLAIQYRMLAKHPTARVCYLSDQLHFYFNTKQLYWESWGDYHSGGIQKYSLIPGTIMAYKDGFDFRYPSSGAHCRAGEDTILAYNVCENSDNVNLISGLGHIMVYTFHGKNVWSIDHHLNLSNQRAMPISFMLKNRDKICHTIESVDLGAQIKVMGREGLAFIYEGKNDQL